MKRFLLLSTLAFFAFFVASAQVYPTKKQMKKRKAVLKSYYKDVEPLIILDDSRKISKKEFVNCPDVDYYVPNLRIKETASSGGDSISAIKVFTIAYEDSAREVYFHNRVKSFRSNEILSFFGKATPLILCDGKEISVKEYVAIPDESIAFVNFYMNPYVRACYAPKGENGVVYVKLREKAVSFRYNDGMTLPVNGRNYMEELFSNAIPPFLPESYYTGNLEHYVSSKVEEHAAEWNGINAFVVMSCQVDTLGKVEPIMPEWLESDMDLSEEQKGAVIKVAKDIISEMPLFEYGIVRIYNERKRRYEVDRREFSITIPFCFGDMKSKWACYK